MGLLPVNPSRNVITKKGRQFYSILHSFCSIHFPNLDSFRFSTQQQKNRYIFGPISVFHSLRLHKIYLVKVFNQKSDFANIVHDDICIDSNANFNSFTGFARTKHY